MLSLPFLLYFSSVLFLSVFVRPFHSVRLSFSFFSFYSFCFSFSVHFFVFRSSARFLFLISRYPSVSIHFFLSHTSFFILFLCSSLAVFLPSFLPLGLHLLLSPMFFRSTFTYFLPWIWMFLVTVHSLTHCPVAPPTELIFEISSRSNNKTSKLKTKKGNIIAIKF